MSSSVPKTILTLLSIVGISGVSWAVVVISAFRAIYKSIQPLPPTKKQLKEEPVDKHPLFRYVPELKNKVAWRQIGNYPTPVHRCEVGKTSFYVKREDLSSEIYGGNKVRTLQHQLASCEAHKESVPNAKFVVLGSGGSNQVVASVVHGITSFGIKPTAAYPMDDPPDMDNALNMLSVMSFPTNLAASGLKIAKTIGSHLFNKDNKVFMLGGNNVSGVLGQMGGALELAEQIQSGEVPDPELIYVAAGSNCTSIGLLMGITVARRTPSLNKAFRNPNFKLVVMPIHHGFASLQRNLGLYGTSISKYIPMTPLHGIAQTCAFIVSKGGPDLEKECVQTFRDIVEYSVEEKYVGQYGEHSQESIKASKEYDQDGKVFDLENNTVDQNLWLCGHFTSKPMAVLLRELKKRNKNENKDLDQDQVKTHNVLFWQTKSAVLPKGPLDEYTKMQQLTKNNKKMAKWFFDAKAHSSLRPGSVSPDKGPETYQSVMTATKI